VDLYFEYVNIHSHLYNFDVDEFLSKQDQILSPLEKVQQVEETKKREGITYDEAIDLIESETGERLFKNYESFKGVRYRFKKYL